MNVIVAMSGGVDSSVAAYLLKEQGFQVTGLSFELWDRRDLRGSNVCCSVETMELARSVAHRLGIKHHTVDVRDAFYRQVIESFCEAYLGGITPNPCILCNKYIKFHFLLKKAEEQGADYVATGHYARIEKADARESGTPGRFLLKKGVDSRKDQSYVLYVMKQEELSKTLFPLGELTKEKTREIARDIGLETAMRAESQEICFVGDDTYPDFIKGFSPESLRPGPITDTSGNVIGEHRGIAFYTLGQRKRLGISSLKPRYVVHIDRLKNIIVVGSQEDAMKKNFRVTALNWIAVDALSNPLRAHIKVRSTMKEVPAIIIPEKEDHVFVEFDEPQWAPAPGQSAVFYDNNLVIGGGIIE
jgi:tRNA-specific 2-thiouridylase